MRFRDIVGHRDLINRIIQAVDKGRIPHTQLYLGEEGREMLPLALAYSQFINCKAIEKFENIETEHSLLADSCGKCTSCVKFQNLAHPDLHFFFPNNTNDKVKKDPKSAEFMDLWRALNLEKKSEFSLQDLSEKMGFGNKQGSINTRDTEDILHITSLKNFEAKYKVIILWMVERLYHAAAPRLLKTLEEPNKGTIFLLLCENNSLLLPTILSRSQIIQIPPLSKEESMEYLKIQYGFGNELARNAVLKSGGNLVRAIEKAANDEREKEFEEVFEQWMRHCYIMDIPGINLIGVQTTAYGREKHKAFLLYALQNFRYALLLRYNNKQAVNTDEATQNFLNKFSSVINENNIAEISELFDKAIYYIERNANGNILMMNLSIKLCRIFALQKKRK